MGLPQRHGAAAAARREPAAPGAARGCARVASRQVDVCETLLAAGPARPRPGGRPREAALQLRVGLEALLAELPGAGAGRDRERIWAGLEASRWGDRRSRGTRALRAGASRRGRGADVTETLGDLRARPAPPPTHQLTDEIVQGGENGGRGSSTTSPSIRTVGVAVVGRRALGDDRERATPARVSSGRPATDRPRARSRRRASGRRARELLRLAIARREASPRTARRRASPSPRRRCK